MIRFSAARAAGDSKIFYKNYVKKEVKTVAELAEIALTYSISSYIYGAGVTSSGEACEGHKAGESVVGAGTVLMYDFDAKHGPGLTGEEIEQKLEGVASWMGGSKGWRDDLPKYHVVVVIDRELPLDKEEFVRWHRAGAQWLGFEGHHDPAMEAWTQQMAPSNRRDVPHIVVSGSPLPMVDVLAAYVEGVEVREKSGDSLIEGEVPADAIFTLSSNGEKVGVVEMLSMVAGGHKVRVHCLAGIKHDGRDDTALVRGSDDGTAYYHCTGGRCGKTLALRDPAPFEEVEGDEEVEIERKGGLAGLLQDLPYIIEDKFGFLLAGRKVTDKHRESAFNLAMRRALAAMDVRLVEDELMVFDGIKWGALFGSENEAFRFIQKAYRVVGFDVLAGSLSAVKNSWAMMRKTAVVGVPTLRGNFVNMLNGMFCLDTWQLLPADREAMFTHALPFSYQPGVLAPTWGALVKRIMLGSPELIEAFKQSVGYLFTRDLNLEVMIGFVGEGANGKSTVIEVMRRLVGEAGASTVSMNLLTKPSGEGQYARAGLAGKVVNFTNELSPVSLMSSEFKDLISGQQIQARHPYGKPFVIPYGPKHVCAMNTTRGLIRENTHAFTRRLHLVPFGYTVRAEDKDAGLMGKLLAELPGIMNWVLEGAKTVVQNKKLFVAPEMQRLLGEVVRDSDQVMQFLEECCEMHPTGLDEVHPRRKLLGMMVGLNELYGLYKEFCVENGYRHEGRNVFSKEVQRLGFECHNKAVKDGADGVVKVTGFYLKTRLRKEWGTGKPALLLVKR